MKKKNKEKNSKNILVMMEKPISEERVHKTEHNLDYEQCT